MASETDEIAKNIENLKTTVRASFARIYAALKARELKTLRQLDAIRKQSQDDKDLNRNCNQNIRICFDNESNLLENVEKYGAIDFERLNFDSSTFVLEDYINPDNDHMYSYKDITSLENLAIEEAALKQITATENCVCNVDIRIEDVSKKFRDSVVNLSQIPLEDKSEIPICEDLEESLEAILEPVDISNSSSDLELKKIEPTQEWLNSIKSHTETEPSQNVDVMEHSTIACT